MTYSILFTTKKLQTVLEEMGLIAVFLAVVLPWLGRNFFRTVETLGRGLAREKKKAILAAALFPMIARLLLLPIFPPPKPIVHDEFSYLTQGDTFAHGRVTNPTPPFWEHFETEYMLFQPTYASQYQPLPGVFLAVGQLVFHDPWFGVWLSVGLMCGAICWALMYALPPGWALFGAFASALQFGIFGFWMNSYFGGAVPAAGGALVFGALLRMRKPGKLTSSGVICALGIVVLMASRPFEGLIWSGIALLFSARLLWKVRPAAPVFRKALVWSASSLLAGAIILCSYNAKVTGSPFLPPYLKYRLTYGTPQSYWWQAPVVVTTFNNQQLHDNFTDQYKKWKARDNPAAVWESTSKRLRDFWRFFIGPLFTPALLFLGVVATHDRRIRPWLYASIPFVIDHATYHAWYPQQTAPATILIVLLIVQCWRHMRLSFRNRGVGLALSRNLIATMALAVFLAGLGKAAEPVLPHSMATWPRIWQTLYQPKRLREDIIADLEKIPGKHLLFVKYSPGHSFYDEWIFNSAELRDQRIVFARPRTSESDAALCRYLQDYDVWVIEPDRSPYLLSRIETGTQLARLSALPAPRQPDEESEP